MEYFCGASRGCHIAKACSLLPPFPHRPPRKEGHPTFERTIHFNTYRPYVLCMVPNNKSTIDINTDKAFDQTVFTTYSHRRPLPTWPLLEAYRKVGTLPDLQLVGISITGVGDEVGVAAGVGATTSASKEQQGRQVVGRNHNGGGWGGDRKIM